MSKPFRGLFPTTTTTHARWVVDDMEGKEGVALVVPSGFDAYARVLHPLLDGERWASVAPEYLTRGGSYPYPFPEQVAQVEGDFRSELVDALVPMLTRATTTPDRCHFGLWNGWGELHGGGWALLQHDAGSGSMAALHRRRERRRVSRERQRRTAPILRFADACAIQPWWGGRDMILFDGPITRVDSIGSTRLNETIARRGPQWWWPEDRSWFAANDIDHPWSYITGSADLIAALGSRGDMEVVVVDHADMW